MALCVNFTACDDDDDEYASYATEILGLWECIETSHPMDGFFDEGDGVKFFDGWYTDPEWDFVSGKKCFLANSPDYLTDRTEDQWSGGYRYTINSNTLVVMESDADRYVGTIVIDGDILTYTCMYQDWVFDDRYMDEETGPYTVKFQRK